MIRWEYRIEKVTLEPHNSIGIQKVKDVAKIVVDRMNELGEDGWEFVSAGGPLGPDGCHPLVVEVLYFKRPKNG